MKVTALALVLLALGACATNSPAQTARYMSLPKEEFKRQITVKDGPLDTVAAFDTADQHGNATTNSMRGLVAKPDGVSRYQLYVTVDYWGQGWRFYDSATAETPSGPKNLRVVAIKRDVEACDHIGGCAHQEIVGIYVDEKLMRAIAAKYIAGQAVGWSYKLSSQSGVENTFTVAAGEVAALLETMDDYAAKQVFALSR